MESFSSTIYLISLFSLFVSDDESKSKFDPNQICVLFLDACPFVQSSPATYLLVVFEDTEFHAASDPVTRSLVGEPDLDVSVQTVSS